MSPLHDKQKTQFTSLCVFFISLYVIGWTSSIDWWGSHSLAFLPTYVGLLVILSAVMLLYLGYAEKLFKFSFKAPQLSWPSYLLYATLLSAFCGFLFHHLPIAIDAMGDTLRFEGFFRGPDNSFKPIYLQTLLSLDVIDFQNGERTVLNAMHLLSSEFNISPRRTFQWMCTVSGSIYVFQTCVFLRLWQQPQWLKTMAGMLFLSAPFIWMFFGHMEIYAPSIVLITAYLMCLIIFFQQPNKLKLLGLLVLLFLCIKFHSANFMLLPSYLLTVSWFLSRHRPSHERWFNWKVFSWVLLLPCALVGCYLYFLVFQDHIDPRTMAPLKEQLFLPLFAPPAPLDRYNLLSPVHFFDYWNMLLMLSSAAVFILLSVLIFDHKNISWQQPLVIIIGITLLLYLAFYFVFNPLLGMPLDMDLFSLIGPVLIAFTLVVLSARNHHSNQQILLAGIVALSLFTGPLLAVNSLHSSAADKLTALGLRTFKTYWMGGARPLIVSMNQQVKTAGQLDQYLTEVLPYIETHVTAQNDIEYAELLRQIAEKYRRFEQIEKAHDYYQQAYFHDIGNEQAALALTESFFKRQDYERSYELSQHLLSLRFPSTNKAMRMMIHCAIMAERYDAALLHSQDFLELWPGDDFISQVAQHLKSGTNLNELKNEFQQ